MTHCQNFFLQNRNHGKISYERRAYESADDDLNCYTYISKFYGKKASSSNGLKQPYFDTVSKQDLSRHVHDFSEIYINL